MEPDEAIGVFAALAQPTRLAVVAELVRDDGGCVSVGALAERIGTSPASMSAHVAVLARAGLVRQRQSGKQVMCSAVPERLGSLTGFLQALTPRRGDA